MFLFHSIDANTARFPGGHCREDHTKRRVLCEPDNPPLDGWNPEARGLNNDDEPFKHAGSTGLPAHACTGPSERCHVCEPNMWSSDPNHRPGRTGPMFYTSVRPEGSPLAAMIPLDLDTVYQRGSDKRGLANN